MTTKQRQILAWLAGETKAGRPASLDQLIAKLGEGSSKQAMQSTLATLEAKKLLERQYEVLGSRKRRLVVLTRTGMDLGAALLR